jgi:DNA invertase Pin-like site-specific DNA recombinase
VRVGYVRVSSVDQNTVRQLDGIQVERTFTDKASGKDTARPKLDELVSFVRDGGTCSCTRWTGWRATSTICAASCGC